MTNPTINQFNEQMEKFFAQPARAFADLGINHAESLVSTQVEAAKAYTDLGMRQARAALDIQQPQDVQSYVQGQQEVVKELGERVKGDAEKVVELNRQFAEKAQELTKENAEKAQKAAKSTAKSG